MNEGQRASVAAKLANMSHGGNRKLDQAENLPLVSQAKAAEMLNVSDRSVRTAKKIQEEAIPQISAKVSAGEISLQAAADIATLPREEQEVIVATAKNQKINKLLTFTNFEAELWARPVLKLPRNINGNGES